MTDQLWMRGFVRALWAIADSDPTQDEVLALLVAWAPGSPVPESAWISVLAGYIKSELEIWQDRFDDDYKVNASEGRRALERILKQLPAPPVPESASGTCPTCFGFVNKCGHSKMRVYSQPCNDGSGMSMTICGPCQSASNSVTWPAPPAEKGKKP